MANTIVMHRRLSPLPGPQLHSSAIRALFAPGFRFMRLFANSSAFRAWWRFNLQLIRVPRYQKGTVKYAGYKISYIDAASFLSAWHDIFVCRMYEVIPPSGRPPRLIDAGANLGLAALFWGNRYGKFDYVGFEPDPKLADVARQNLRAWGCEGQLHQVAVAAGPGESAFDPDGADGGRLVARGEIQVQTVDLSEYLHEPVDLLKIDIEGAEHDVLAAIDSKLEMVRNLFVEIHSPAGQPSRWGATIALLERAGFTCYAQPVRAPWLPFLEPPACDAGYSDQFNVFAVRNEL